MPSKRLRVGAILLVLAALFVGWLCVTRASASRSQNAIAAAAMMDLHQYWESGGRHFPDPWPTAIQALRVNSLGASTSPTGWKLSAHRVHSLGPLRWTDGYQLATGETNAAGWTLYKDCGLYIPHIPALRWRRPLMVVPHTVQPQSATGP